MVSTALAVVLYPVIRELLPILRLICYFRSQLASSELNFHSYIPSGSTQGPGFHLYSPFYHQYQVSLSFTPAAALSIAAE